MRAGVKDGKKRDEVDQVDVWCFPGRQSQPQRRIGVKAIGDLYEEKTCAD